MFLNTQQRDQICFSALSCGHGWTITIRPHAYDNGGKVQTGDIK